MSKHYYTNILSAPMDYLASVYSDWAFGDSASAKRWRYETRDVPIIGDLSKWYDTRHKTNDYMKNRNIDWSSVKYPSIMESSAGGSYNALISPTIESLESLYKGEEWKRERKEREYTRALQNEHYREGIRANQMRRAWYYSRL